MRRERDIISFYTDFSIWLHRVRPPAQTAGLASASSENRLPSSGLESQLSDSTNAWASRRSKLVSPRRAPKIVFLVRKFKSLLTASFQIPEILSASRHDVTHVPGSISHLGFLLWHLWLSHPPRVHLNTRAQCVHLTNPCTKRKVLSLTKPKGKIYKTKSLRDYFTPSNTDSVSINTEKVNTTPNTNANKHYHNFVTKKEKENSVCDWKKMIEVSELESSHSIMFIIWLMPLGNVWHPLSFQQWIK